MRAELISVGTELLLGEVLNTNAQYLSRRLSEVGIDCYFQHTVGDNPSRLRRVLEEALAGSDLVITTGGLGPTMDDLTKETVAQFLGLPLVLHQPSLDRIEALYRRLGRVMPPSNLKQALLPEGSTPLPNDRGTAPGMAVLKDGKMVVILPGPPSEMVPMFENQAVPFIETTWAGRLRPLVARVMRFCGIGESDLETRIRDIIEHQSDPMIAPYVKAFEVQLRLSTRASSREEGLGRLGPVERAIAERLGGYLYGFDEVCLEDATGRRLRSLGLRVAVAESCTGGWLSKRLTGIPGSSDYFLFGAVTYSNQSKISLLGVPAATIEDNGAVSEETVQAMAAGARAASGAEIGIGITGVAGPGGGTEEKPVGTVWIGLSGPWGDEAKLYRLWGGRDDIRGRAAQEALVRLWRYLSKHAPR